MADPLNVNANPCPSCPYRRDCPSGVWAHEEYEKLRAYDDRDAMFLPVFLCHHSNAGPKTVCKGWLTVHAEDSKTIRLMYYTGQVTAEQVMQKPTVPLFATGKAAADAGQKKIRQPGKRARRIATSLLKRGAGKV